MAMAYVGTADRYGLEWFLREDEETIAAVATRAFDGPLLRRAPFWATVSDELASRIRAQLRAGRRLRALMILETDAEELAPLSPCYKFCYAASTKGNSLNCEDAH